MKHRHSSILINLCMLFIALTLLMSMSCERILPVQLENRTDMVLTIYVQGKEYGEVEAHKSMAIRSVSITASHVLIKAKNRDGDVIFSKKFGIDELYESDWKIIVLPPSEI